MKKNKVKRLLSIILATAILITTLPSAVFAAITPSEWAVSEVEFAEQAGIITDKIKTDFHQDITREEFCELAIKLYTAITGIVPEIVADNFTDVANEDVSRAFGLGIVFGISETEFLPNRFITRQEICAMLVRTINAALPRANVEIYPSFELINELYNDAQQVSDWARPSVFYAIGNDIMKGVQAGEWNNFICPLDNTSREQAVLLAWRVYDNREVLSESDRTEFLTFEGNDTDGDGLSDDDEINIYGTDPFLADTDGDGVDDGWEIFYGTNPLVPDRVFTQTKTTGEVGEFVPVAASVTLNLRPEQVGTLAITPVTVRDEVLLSPLIPGYLGAAYDFTVDGDIGTARMTFEYDTSLGTVSADFQPRIYFFNDEFGTLEELPNQTVTNGRVTATVTHFSKYILLNSVPFNLVWATEIRKPAIVSGTGNINEDFDVVFVIDESSSMEANTKGTNNDPNGLRRDAVRNFIDNMNSGDRAAIVGFSTDPRMLTRLTYDLEAARTQVENILGNRGGTAIFKGIAMGIAEFYGRDSLSESLRGYAGDDIIVGNTRPGAEKILIVLTDGYDDPDAPRGTYDIIIEDAQRLGITIYTIGLGNDMNIAKTLLVDIAEQTGGRYFHATKAEELYQGFELIQDETLDLVRDSNGDGIADYYARLIFEGLLPMSNGSLEFMGVDLESNPDYDGDGLLNGQEIVVVEINGNVMARMMSDPTLPDTDFDGLTDDIDPHPLFGNYFSTNTSDFRRLTDNSHYMYTVEAERYSSDEWGQMGDGLVTFLSFTDLQKEYTQEMANFFINNANEDYVNQMAMAEMESIIKENVAEEIAKYINDGMGIISGGIETIATVDKARRLAEIGSKITQAKANHAAALAAGRSAKSLGGYQSWVTRHTNAHGSLKATKVGVSNSALKGIQKVGQGIAIAFIAYDSYKLVESQVDIWNLVQGIAKTNAQNNLFTLNEDLFLYLRDNASQDFTRRAARFMLDSMYEGYAEVLSQMTRNAVIMGGKVAFGVLLLVASGPAVIIAGVAMAVFSILDTALGWSANAKTRGRIMCLYDMTNATIVFVNKYYLSDDAQSWDRTVSSPPNTTRHLLGRHLENLVNLRITGESRFVDLNGHNTTATQNIAEAIIIADRMGLFIIE